MYALANVEKFLGDHKTSISPQKRGAILKRARHQAEPDNILMGGMAEDVWRDKELLKKFYRELGTNIEHTEIGVAAIRAARRKKVH